MATVTVTHAQVNASASGAFVHVTHAQVNATPPAAAPPTVTVTYAAVLASPQQLGGGMAVYVCPNGKWIPATTYRNSGGTWA